MSETPKNGYTITKLSFGSTAVLRHLLNQTGWTKTITEFITAAELLARVIPEVENEPERPHPAVAKNYREELSQWKDASDKWLANTVADFNVTEKQRDNIKTCIKYHVEKSGLPPSKASYDLLTTFGLTE